MEWLQGKKTYIVAFGVIVAAVVAFTQGQTDLAGMVNEVLVGLGLATLRAGVAKGVK